jgi:hypothetical protein
MVPQRPLPVQGREQRTREVQAWLQALVLVLAWLQALVLAWLQALVQAWLQALVQVQALVTQSQQQPPWRRAGERQSAIGLPWCWR